jgi:hypothetical protein
LFTDRKQAEAQDEMRRHDLAIFDPSLTPEWFFRAARMGGLPIALSPLNLINLVWLAGRAARNPKHGFADILTLSRKTLQDQESFAASPLAKLLKASRPLTEKPSPYDPRQSAGEPVAAAAFSKARQRLPSAFWVALLVLLSQRFRSLYPQVVRGRRFRLLALDGTEVLLPDWPAWRGHCGTPRNASGSHGPQARLVLLPYPLARRPRAYALEPRRLGASSMARGWLQGLCGDEWVLLDAGFLCYGLLCQIHHQGACFCLRLKKSLNLRRIKQLRKQTGGRDVLVEWSPKDSRGQWRKEGLPRSLTLRLLTYAAKGFRPLQLLTDVLSAQEVPYEQWWGLSVSAEGAVLCTGAYNLRWELETTYLELKVQQGLEGGLRSPVPAGISYEVAGHILYYLLVRWVLVEAAAAAEFSRRLGGDPRAGGVGGGG